MIISRFLHSHPNISSAGLQEDSDHVPFYFFLPATVLPLTSFPIFSFLLSFLISFPYSSLLSTLLSSPFLTSPSCLSPFLLAYSPFSLQSLISPSFSASFLSRHPFLEETRSMLQSLPYVSLPNIPPPQPPAHTHTHTRVCTFEINFPCSRTCSCVVGGVHGPQ